MYEAIESSGVIVRDLTGHCPNVHVEAGYALSHHEKGRLVFLLNPSDEHDEVPLDLTTFKCVPIGQAAEISDRLGGEIEAILAASGCALQGQTTSPGGSLLRRPLADSSTGVDTDARRICDVHRIA